MQVQWQITADINRKFNFSNISEAFERGFRDNEKKIFGELTESDLLKVRIQKLKRQLNSLD